MPTLNPDAPDFEPQLRARVLAACLRWRGYHLDLSKFEAIMDRINRIPVAPLHHRDSRCRWGRRMRSVLRSLHYVRSYPYRKVRSDILKCKAGLRPLEGRLIHLLARFVSLDQVVATQRLPAVDREELHAAFLLRCDETLHRCSKRWRSWALQCMAEAQRQVVPRSVVQTLGSGPPSRPDQRGRAA